MKQSEKINRLIELMEKVAERPSAPIAPIAPIAPVAPVLPIIPPNPDDHNLLIRLDTKVDALKADIAVLSDGTTVKINDHESRIRANEKSITQIMTWGSALIVVIGIAEFFLNHIWTK